MNFENEFEINRHADGEGDFFVESKKITKASYEQIDYDALDNQLSALKHPEILLYGFGYYGRHVYNTCLWKHSIQVVGFVDRDTTKQGQIYCGINVIALDDVLKKYVDIPVLISPYDEEGEIYNQLLSFGIADERLIRLPFKRVSCDIVSADAYFDQANDIDYASVPSPAPRVTVYSTIYNMPERFLRRAIESVLSQSVRDFTYHIMDNGSTGKTTEIIQEYASLDARITVDRYEWNAITGNLDELAARHWKSFTSFETAYFCWLDSDDYYDATFLEHTLQAARTYNADIVKVHTLGINAGENNTPRRPPGALKQTIAIGQEALRVMMMEGWGYYGMWGALYRTEAFMRQLRPDMCYLDYYKVINAIIHSDRVVRFDKVMHYQTQGHSGSSSLQVRTDMKYAEMIIMMELTRTIMQLEWLAPSISVAQYNGFIFEQGGLTWLCAHYRDCSGPESTKMFTYLLKILDKEPYRSIVPATSRVKEKLAEVTSYFEMGGSL